MANVSSANNGQVPDLDSIVESVDCSSHKKIARVLLNKKDTAVPLQEIIDESGLESTTSIRVAITAIRTKFHGIAPIPAVLNSIEGYGYTLITTSAVPLPVLVDLPRRDQLLLEQLWLRKYDVVPREQLKAVLQNAEQKYLHEDHHVREVIMRLRTRLNGVAGIVSVAKTGYILDDRPHVPPALLNQLTADEYALLNALLAQESHLLTREQVEIALQQHWQNIGVEPRPNTIRLSIKQLAACLQSGGYGKIDVQNTVAARQAPSKMKSIALSDWKTDLQESAQLATTSPTVAALPDDVPSAVPASKPQTPRSVAAKSTNTRRSRKLRIAPKPGAAGGNGVDETPQIAATEEDVPKVLSADVSVELETATGMHGAVAQQLPVILPESTVVTENGDIVDREEPAVAEVASPTVAEESSAEPAAAPDLIRENRPVVSVEPEVPAEQPVEETAPAAVAEGIRDEPVSALASDVIEEEALVAQPQEPAQELVCEQVVSQDIQTKESEASNTATPPPAVLVDFDPEVHLDSDDFEELTVDEVMEEFFAMDELWEELELLETAAEEGWLHWLDEDGPCPVLEKHAEALVRALGLRQDLPDLSNVTTAPLSHREMAVLTDDMFLESDADVFVADDDEIEEREDEPRQVRVQGGVIDTYDDVRLPRNLEAPDPDEEPMPFASHVSEDDFTKTDALPGTEEKIEVLRGRLQQGLPLYHKEDRLHYSEEE